MSIRLRLAVVFAVASAVVFALGSWLFVTELSSSLLGSIDAQLAVRLDQADRYLPVSGAPAQPRRAALRPVSTSSRSSTPPGVVRGASADAGTDPDAQRSRAQAGPAQPAPADQARPRASVSA